MNANEDHSLNLLNSHKYSSFYFDNYMKLFFDDEFDIKVIGNLINESNVRTVKMIHILLKIKEIIITLLYYL